MPKLTRRSNIRVEVEPHFWLQPTEDEQIATCEDIADQIRRHVDGLRPHAARSGADRGVNVVWDTDAVCEHCGYRWTEDGDTYNGGCCAEDEKSNPVVSLAHHRGESAA